MDKELKAKIIKVAHILSNKNVYIDDAKFIINIIEEQQNKIERLKKNEKFFADCITNALNYIYELKSNCDDPALDKIINKLKGDGSNV